MHFHVEIINPKTIQTGFIFITKICYFCNPVSDFSLAGSIAFATSFAKASEVEEGYGGQNAPSPGLWSIKRGVAQLVAYYVRDVGAGSSSLLTPTF